MPTKNTNTRRTGEDCTGFRTEAVADQKQFAAAFTVCALLLCVIALFLLCRPDVFPASGWNGPAHWRTNTPPGIRFSGDSYRYIGGATRLLEARPLDAEQSGYRGYIYVVTLCLAAHIGLPGLIAIQVLAALAALFCVMWLARRMAGLPAACVTGALFALNADMAVWETFIMTETLYIAAVCACACLMLLAHERKRPTVYAAVFAAVLLFAFIRPTGWILPPAALLFWLLNAPWKWRWRASASLAVVILFLAIAFGMPQARGGIEGQGPVAKLYAGEVVWQEALWRVNMPSPPQDTGTFAAACGYIAHHPLACTHLALRRVAVLFLKVRPGYSRAHNALLLALYLPLALLGIAGFILCRRNIAAHAALTLVLAHALVVALTFNLKKSVERLFCL